MATTQQLHKNKFKQNTPSQAKPVSVTDVTLQDTCRSIRDVFFTDWPEKSSWTVELNTQLGGRFKCVSTERRIEIGHIQFRDRDALRATIMAFYALARNQGQKDTLWEAELRRLGAKASFIGRYWLATYLTELAKLAKHSKLPAIYLDPDVEQSNRSGRALENIDGADLCFIHWPLAMYDVIEDEDNTDKLYEDSLSPQAFNRQLIREAG